MFVILDSYSKKPTIQLVAVQLTNNCVQHVTFNTLKELVVQGILCGSAISSETKPEGKNTRKLIQFQRLCENSKS